MSKYLSILCALFLVASFGSLQADPVTMDPIHPSADTDIKDNNPQENYGGDDQFRAGACGTSPDYYEARALLQFVLDIPAGKVITAADLYVKTSWCSGSPDIEARALTENWTEGTGTAASPGTDGVCWDYRHGSSDTLWTNAGGTFGATVYDTVTVNAGSTSFSWDIKDLVQDWYDGDITNNGVILLIDEYVSGQNENFGSKSRSFYDATRHPYLQVTYDDAAVPEPATMLLVGTGLLGLAGVIRRRRMK